MSSPLHSKQTISDGIHSPIAYTYLSASARNSAIGFDPEDLYKLSRQLDDGSTWQLIQVSPPQWQLFVNSGSISADIAASYLVLNNTSSLTNERAFTIGTGLSAIDAGSNSTYTVSINNNVVATVSGTTFTGPVSASGGLTGSLQQVSPGLSYLVAGQSITITTQSNGQIVVASTATGGGDPNPSYLVLSNTASLSNERALTIGTGLAGTDGGANSTYTISINNNVVATVSGTTFTGDVSLGGNNVTNVDSITFVPLSSASITPAPGRIYYNSDDGALSVFSDIANTSLQIGQEMYVRVYNNSTSSISDGQTVYLNGSLGWRPTVALASNTADHTAHVLGVATADIAINDEGYITTFGYVRDLDTSAFSVGDELYISSTPGLLTNIKPTGSGSVFQVATCIRSHPNFGIIFVDIKGPQHLADLHDVYDAPPTSGSYLRADGLWWRTSDFTTDVLTVVSTSAGKADINASYLVLSNTASLSAERALAVGTGLAGTDAGANSTYTLAINNNVVATVSGTTFTGPISASGGLTGSLQLITPGLPYLVGSGSVTVTTQSNGQVSVAVNLSGTVTHSNLLGLQGGLPGQYYHLDFAHWNSVTNGPTGDPNGFLNKNDTYLSWNNTTRTLTLSLATGSTSYVVYEYGGGIYTYTGSLTSTVSSYSSGSYWFYIYSGSLLNAAVTSPAQLSAGFKSALVAAVYVNNGLTGSLTDERHGSVMDWKTHEYLHKTVSTRYEKGFDLAQLTVGNGGVDTDAQISLTGGTIWDEDIDIVVTRTATPTNNFEQELGSATSVAGRFPIMYRSGSGSDNWVTIEPTNFPIFQNVAGQRVVYNNDPGSGFWQATQISSNNNYAIVWIVATNYVTGSVRSFLGQGDYGTLSDAQATSFSSMVLGTLPITEFKLLYRLIYQTSTAKGNAIKAALVDVTDYRQTSTLAGSGFTAISHASLAGLTLPNSHPASAISVITTNFTSSNSILGTGATDVQTALNDISALAVPITGATFTGAVRFNAGLSGSLTQLTSGQSYIVAGSNIAVVTSSVGQITISTPLQPAADLYASYVVVSTTASLPNERALASGAGIAITDGGVGNNVTISNTQPGDQNATYLVLSNTASLNAERAFVVGTGLTGTDAGANSTYTLAINNNVVATVSGTTFTGPISASGGLTGSLQLIAPGLTYLVAGQSITITSQSNGQIVVASTATGGGDPNPSYLVLSNTASLSNERALTIGTGLTASDGGANSTYTLAINNNVVATISGTRFTGPVSASGGLTGSLQLVSPGLTYLVAGTNVTITSQSNGQVVIASTGGTGGSGDPNATYLVLSNTASLSAERALTIGTGLTGTDGGVNSTYTLAINNNVVATISGTTFTGPVTFSSTNGATGSLTRISSTVVAFASAYNSGINIVTASNNQVQFSVNNNVVATISGTTFTGPVSASNGLSGSLQQVGPGLPYLITSGSLRTSSGSNGQVTLFAPPRTAYFEFALTEEVNNTERYFYAYRSAGGANFDAQRSGANAGIQNADTCSPIQIPFNGRIVEAVLTLKGAGVQNGSVTYPVTYQTTLFQQGFSAESSAGSINFSISNAFTVGTFSVGSTNFSGSTGLNINVSKGQLFGLKFTNGVGASVVGQTRNAFVTLIVEER